MTLISPLSIMLLLISTALQIFAIYMIPLTRGLTAPLPAIVWGLALIVSSALVVRVVNAGVNLSLIVPMMSAVVPLGGIAVAIFIYGEPASFLKVGALVAACALVGAANLA